MAGILDGMEAWVGSGGGDIGGREGGGVGFLVLLILDFTNLN